MKIETGQPTYKQVKVGAKLKYPFDKVNVGECLTLDETDNHVSVINSAYQYGKRTGKKFRSEKGADNVIRIYRIN